MTTYSDDQLVSRYLELRTFVEAETAKQQEFIKPFTESMAVITNELHRRLLERNPNWQPGMKASGSAGGGTFFLKTSQSVKVADRQQFFDYVFEHRAVNMLTAHVAKDAVEEYQEKHNDALPPGITVDRIVQLQVRKV
jgi:hypothetical protein